MIHRLTLTTALVACMAVPALAGTPPSAFSHKVLTIYPLGDSITFGYSRSAPNHWVPGGYRGYLYGMLVKAGYVVHFVGSTTRNPSPAMARLHDAQHDGWPGWRIDQIASHVKGWLATGGYRFRGPAYPNFILLHIGTNDLAQYVFSGHRQRRLSEAQFMHDMEARMIHLVKELVTLRPKAHLLVAQIIPMGGPPHKRKAAILLKEVRTFNAFIKNTLVPMFQRRGAHVALVNQYRTFATPAGQPIWTHLMPDGVHPDAVGYQMMARTWFKAIVKIESPARQRRRRPLH